MNTNRIPLTRGRFLLPVIFISAWMTFLGGAATTAYAASKTPQTSAVNVDPAKTRNKRHLTQQSARKAAAKRLKTVHQKLRQQKLDRWVNSHHGYTGTGRRG